MKKAALLAALPLLLANQAADPLKELAEAFAENLQSGALDVAGPQLSSEEASILSFDGEKLELSQISEALRNCTHLRTHRFEDSVYLSYDCRGVFNSMVVEIGGNAVTGITFGPPPPPIVFRPRGTE